MKKVKLIFAVVALLAIAFMFASCASSAEKQAKQTMLELPSVREVDGLRNKLEWLQENAQSNENYILDVNSDENLNSSCGGSFFSKIFCGNFSYKDKHNITITLRGIGSNRTISSLEKFTVGSGVTLVLKDNITLKETVIVNGTLVMYEGSEITGAINDYNTFDNLVGCITLGGGGVCVGDRGTFIMKGGVISGNAVKRRVRVPSAQDIRMCNVSVGLANSNQDSPVANSVAKRSIKDCSYYPASDLKGGGVYVSESSIFTKTGGVITGYNANSKKGNAVKDSAGKAISGNGHAIYFGGKEPKAFDATIGSAKNLSFKNGRLEEYEEEQQAEPVNEEYVTEPVNEQ